VTNQTQPKVVKSSSSYSPALDSENLLTLFDDIVLARSVEPSKEFQAQPLMHFEELLESTVKGDGKMNNFESIIFSFEQIADPDTVLERFQMAPFHLFVKYNNFQGAEYCLRMGVDINSRTSIANKEFPAGTALHIATARSLMDMVKYLISKGAKVEERDLNGNSPLHLAAAGGYSDFVKYFYSIKTNFLIANKRNLLPMHSSIMGDNIKTFKI
jgi:ankyrin repeat protein